MKASFFDIINIIFVFIYISGRAVMQMLYELKLVSVRAVGIIVNNLYVSY